MYLSLLLLVRESRYKFDLNNEENVCLFTIIVVAHGKRP